VVTEQKEFYFQLSMLLREFLEYQFYFPATDLTFYELQGTLKTISAIDSQTVQEILRFLHFSDKVKFSEKTVDYQRAEEDKHRVFQWFSQLKVRDILSS